MNFDLSDEQRLIRETARDFTDREIVPRARDNDRNERFDLELVKKARRHGLPRRACRGGVRRPGASTTSGTASSSRKSAGEIRARTVVSVQTSLVAGSIEQWGTEEQKTSLLPKLCAGEWLGCFGLTEPGTGSHAAASARTRATRKNGGWKIAATRC